MSNQNHGTNNGSSANIDPERYQTLCKYVFGELDEVRRAEFEHELASDPALAAERERLEATIGFVQDTLPADELPADMRATLREAATKAFTSASGGEAAPGLRLLPRLVSWSNTPARAAAVCLLILGAGFALRAAWDGPVTPGPAEPVASLREKKTSLVREQGFRDAKGRERALPLEQAEFDGDALEALRSLEYAGDDGAFFADEAFEPTSVPETDALAGLGYVESAGGEDVASGARPARMKNEFRSDTGPARELENRAESGGDAFRLGRGEESQEGARASAELALANDTPLDPTVFEEALALAPHELDNERPADEPAWNWRDTQVKADGEFRGPGDPVPPGGAGRVNEPVLAQVDYMQRSADSEAPKEGESAEFPASSAPSTAVQPRSSFAFGTFGGGFNYFTSVSMDIRQSQLGAGVARFVLRPRTARGPTTLSPLSPNSTSPLAAPRKRRPVLSPEEIVVFTDDLLRGCEIRPNESPSMMFFRCWGAHPFQRTVEDNLSTFAADVDTASYTLARRYLQSDLLPRREQVRTEEFVNYFRADRPAPEDGVFSIDLESAPSLFNADPNVEMLRVTVRGRDVDAFDRQPLALTFVIDVSGSMNDGGRMGLVKESLGLLLTQLDPSDAIALIKFSTSASVVSPMVSAGNRGAVEDAIDALATGGGTNIESGLLMGFELAANELTRNAVNRVILLSDGVGNMGDTQQKSLLASVASYRDQGIYLNTIGVGMGNHNDAFLEQLADRGDGLCQYIDSKAEAEKALVHEFTKTLQPIARDVKIQVEFDPNQVESYRQLGYENRVVADQDFRKDSVDAGEVNAGHQVTALYEVVRIGTTGRSNTARRVATSPLATVRVRYKPPFAVDRGQLGKQATADVEVALEIERASKPADFLTGFDSGSEGYRRAVLVAQFAELLRRSVHTKGDSLESFEMHVMKLAEQVGDPETVEFADLVTRALPFLLKRAEADQDELRTLIHELCRLEYEAGVREQMADREDAEPLDPDVERAFQEELEDVQAQIRELVARRHGAPDRSLETKGLDSLKDLGYSDR